MYNSNSIAEKIKNRSKECGVPIKRLLEDVGLGFNTMSNMKTSMPKVDNLAKIADYLDCSVDYLLGRTNNPDSHKLENNTELLEALEHTTSLLSESHIRLVAEEKISGEPKIITKPKHT